MAKNPCPIQDSTMVRLAAEFAADGVDLALDVGVHNHPAVTRLTDPLPDEPQHLGPRQPLVWLSRNSSRQQRLEHAVCHIASTGPGTIDAHLSAFVLDAAQKPVLLRRGQRRRQEDHLRLRADKTPEARHCRSKVLLIVEDDMALVNDNPVESLPYLIDPPSSVPVT
ncbi:hypothetical protein BDW72DRAFT_199445 [Aspergillus terricola var. indicus]